MGNRWVSLLIGNDRSLFQPLFRLFSNNRRRLRLKRTSSSSSSSSSSRTLESEGNETLLVWKREEDLLRMGFPSNSKFIFLKKKVFLLASSKWLEMKGRRRRRKKKNVSETKIRTMKFVSHSLMIITLIEIERGLKLSSK